MNKPELLIPTALLSGTFLLSGCAAGPADVDAFDKYVAQQKIGAACVSAVQVHPNVRPTDVSLSACSEQQTTYTQKLLSLERNINNSKVVFTGVAIGATVAGIVLIGLAVSPFDDQLRK